MSTDKANREAHFAVDKEGLAKLLERKGKHFAIYELIQNAWDEDATEVWVELIPWEKPGRYTLKVRDDDPDGFTDLSHAYTLFAESEKKSDPEKRGRFNLGEKLVLAICDRASISTTTGSIQWDDSGRWSDPQFSTTEGSVFEGHIRMTKREAEKVERFVTSLIPPTGVATYFNGRKLVERDPVREFRVKLPTEIADEEGRLVERIREGAVSIYSPLEDEKPMLYEMGIPVQRIDTPWHVSIGQKVPLTLDREAARPSYIRAVKAELLNHCHDLLSDEDGAEKWLGEAMEDKRITPLAVDAALTKRFGARRVIFDPSDLEANKIAAAQGYTVIPGRSLSKQVHAAVKQHGLALPAGQVTPSNSTLDVEFTTGEKGSDIPEENWSEGMNNIAAWSKLVAERLLDRSIRVKYVNEPNIGFNAAYSPGLLLYNIGSLGYRWFDNGQCPQVNSLLIHELAHENEADHLDEGYYRALTDLGAALTQLALDEPQVFEAHSALVAV